ncbi:hypothetical protein PR048_013244 [Dryococelus australis]|uniref:Uncharacterized protein n=1 Tax=Dryococelus australis TaxID=614101 RepID=A0ABQ9HRL7_9NEOP|nr:hypothetical protein PR048_013244 [Dryococelus australis]
MGEAALKEQGVAPTSKGVCHEVGAHHHPATTSTPCMAKGVGQKCIRAYKDDIRLSSCDVADEVVPGALTPHKGDATAELQPRGTQEEGESTPPSGRLSQNNLCVADARCFLIPRGRCIVVLGFGTVRHQRVSSSGKGREKIGRILGGKKGTGSRGCQNDGHWTEAHGQQ